MSKVENIKIEDYNKQIELAFYGTGGAIVKDCYDTAIRGVESLTDIVDSIIDEYRAYPEEYSHMDEMFRPSPTDQKELISFIECFMQHKESSPELCGTVAGILFRDGKLEDALKFLEVHDMNKPRYWDT